MSAGGEPTSSVPAMILTGFPLRLEVASINPSAARLSIKALVSDYQSASHLSSLPTEQL